MAIPLPHFVTDLFTKVNTIFDHEHPMGVIIHVNVKITQILF